MADVPTNGQSQEQPQAESAASNSSEQTPQISADTPVEKATEATSETPAETPTETAAEPTGTDPNSPPPEEPPPPPPPTQPAKPMPKRMLFIICGLLLVGLSALFAFIITSAQQPKTSTTNTTNNTSLKPTLIPEKTTKKSDINNPAAYAKLFVYGAWSGQTSLIKAVDLSNQKTTTLATLPNSIKKVSILSAQTLIYVDQTDKQDHGRQLVIYNIKSNAPITNIPAIGGYGIDDYVVSPNKRYVAIWEVNFAPGQSVLMGGKSRVYTVDLTRPSVQNLLYDETATPSDPVHYPRAILNNGRVFADKFLPNDPKGGTGWAYGLSVVDFDGSNAQDLPQMQAGSYGTQPSLSPDGKYLLFSGYDGIKGDGMNATNGYRQAILTPDTVELLETDSLTRKKFAKFDNTNIYTSSEWDPTSGKIILTIVSGDNNTTGVYAYDLNSQELTKISVPSSQSITYGFLTQLTPSMSIIGSKDTSPSNLGNLGESYSYPFTQVALYDTATAKVNFVPIEDTFAQYITVLPGNYFNNVLGIEADAQTQPMPTFVDFYSGQNDPKARQQMYTFVVKYDLAATREAQQSASIAAPEPSGSSSGSGFNFNKNSPRCRELAEQQCTSQGVTAQSSNYNDCVKTNKWSNELQQTSSGACHDSPLYLYGPAGTLVDVSIQTPISNANPSYNNGYHITLATAGKMQINGTKYSSIAYDYISNLKRVNAPARGTVVRKSDVPNVLRVYAKKLGLNEKETADLVLAGEAKAVSEYVFVSFFNQQTSQQILPISFNPQPDNYLNVVFYFKNLDTKPTFTPLPPIFEPPVARNGLTAVEISELAE
jgi:hypothetical protein